jgi:hypothetical protein
MVMKEEMVTGKTKSQETMVDQEPKINDHEK